MTRPALRRLYCSVRLTASVPPTSAVPAFKPAQPPYPVARPIPKPHTPSPQPPPPALSHVTVVDDPVSACAAIQALIAASDRAVPILWTFLSSPSHLLLSAYAGPDIDFGNGPHLFFHISQPHPPYFHHLRRYFSLPHGLHVWSDYPAAVKALSVFQLHPAAPYRDLSAMARLARVSPLRPSKSRLASDPLSLSDILRHAPTLDARTMRHMSEHILQLETTHKDLCNLLTSTPLSPLVAASSPLPPTSTALHAYDSFFRHVDSARISIERTGIPVSVAALNRLNTQLRNDACVSRNTFLTWAARRSPAATYIDVHKPSQLRHLLFAPCPNALDGTKSIPASKSIAVPKLETTRKRRRRVEVSGLGLSPSAYLKSGFPSVSRESLSNLRERAHMSGDSTGLTDALDHLFLCQDLKSRASRVELATKALEEDDRWHMSHDSGGVTLSVSRAWGASKFGQDSWNAISAASGNQLIVVSLERLGLWAVAQLSQCEAMRRRVESDGDATAIASALMYEGIADAVGDGEVVMDGSKEEGRPTVAEKFPVAYRLAGRVDAALRYGGIVGGAGLVGVLTGERRERALQLRRRWYAGHERVEGWHEEWREKVLEDGIAETMMGRRYEVGRLDGLKRYEVEKRLTEGMKAVVEGTKEEALMGATVKVCEDDVLKGLGWSVVLVGGEGLILEGPEYSAEAAEAVVRELCRQPRPSSSASAGGGKRAPVSTKVTAEVVRSLNAHAVEWLGRTRGRL